MKRRTLDLLFSAGGVLFAVLFLILGLVLQNQANFADDYVHDQLSAQRIAFPEEYTSGETEVEGSGCLTDFAGKDLTTGKMAECYANFYIATHMAHSAEEAGLAGETYATVGGVLRTAQADLAAAEEAGEDTTELEARVAEVSGLRESMFKGETLRGLLLTTFGFSIFGERAATAAIVCFLAAALLFLLSIAGFIHALRTPESERVFVETT